MNQWPGRCGCGPRQSFVAISRWANRNFVDHAVAGPTSVLRFIEDNWRAGQRHGLTGQIVVLSEDDLAAYQKHCAQEQPEELATDPAVHFALAQAKALDGDRDLLARLSLYEQRLNRTPVLAKAKLKELQQERAEAEKEALRAAADIRNLKQALNQPWQPEQDGFEFSNAELTLWMRRRKPPNMLTTSNITTASPIQRSKSMAKSLPLNRRGRWGGQSWLQQSFQPAHSGWG